MGNQVLAHVGGSLHIESLQDTETYDGVSKSIGAGIHADVAKGKPISHNESASASKGTMESDYRSVTEQAGIYAGSGGFDITVGKETSLKGAVIDSEASAGKNRLSTGSLRMEDIENKAAYEVKNRGVSYHTYATKKEEQENYNEKGLIPSLLPGVSEEASSTTRSAIAPGSIEVTKQDMDPASINRDTKNALHELGKIFDKKEIEERQELARLFAKYAGELLHKYDRDGTLDKGFLHGLAAEIASRIAGNPAGSGFLAGFTNEMLINKIAEWSENDPAIAQWISATLGGAVNATIGGNVNTGAAVAQYGTKWNNMYHPNIPEGEYANWNDALYVMNELVRKEKENSEYATEPINFNEVYQLIDSLPKEITAGEDLLSTLNTMELIRAKSAEYNSTIALTEAIYHLSNIVSKGIKYADLPLTGALYQAAIKGDGSDQYFYSGSLVSQKIEQSKILGVYNILCKYQVC